MNISEFSFDEKITSICRINQAIELAGDDSKSIEALRMVKKLIQSEINLSELEANKLEEENNKGLYFPFEWDWNSEKHTKDEEIRFQLFILDCAFEQRACSQRFKHNPWKEPSPIAYPKDYSKKEDSKFNDFTL